MQKEADFNYPEERLGVAQSQGWGPNVLPTLNPGMLSKTDRLPVNMHPLVSIFILF